MAVVGAKGAGAVGGNGSSITYRRPELVCTEDQQMSAVILTSLGGMGVMANLALIVIIVIKRPLRRSIIART